MAGERYAHVRSDPPCTTRDASHSVAWACVGCVNPPWRALPLRRRRGARSGRGADGVHGGDGSRHHGGLTRCVAASATFPRGVGSSWTAGEQQARRPPSGRPGALDEPKQVEGPEPPAAWELCKISSVPRWGTSVGGRITGARLLSRLLAVLHKLDLMMYLSLLAATPALHLVPMAATPSQHGGANNANGHRCRRHRAGGAVSSSKARPNADSSIPSSGPSARGRTAACRRAGAGRAVDRGSPTRR